MEKWTVIKDAPGTQATKATCTGRYPVQYLAMRPSSLIIIRMNSGPEFPGLEIEITFYANNFFYFIKLKLIQ